MNAAAAQTESLCCPTCGARQAAAPECRRCKCDLGLVVAVRNQVLSLHNECLRHLRSGAYHDALACALRRYELAPDKAARRLLAVVYLCHGKFQAALDVRDTA